MLNKKVLKQYEKRLLEERQKLLSKLNLEKEAFGDLIKNEVGDPIDKAFNQWEKDRAIDISEADKKQLLEIDGALSRVLSGNYGMCIICNDEINPLRLEAIPWALTCVDPRKCRAKKAVLPPTVPASVLAKPAAKPSVTKSESSKGSTKKGPGEGLKKTKSSSK